MRRELIIGACMNVRSELLCWLEKFEKLFEPSEKLDKISNVVRKSVWDLPEIENIVDKLLAEFGNKHNHCFVMEVYEAFMDAGERFTEVFKDSYQDLVYDVWDDKSLTMYFDLGRVNNPSRFSTVSKEGIFNDAVHKIEKKLLRYVQ